ncbi:MAG: DinB family protein [Gemmatimonadetes bacterium]|nr:DinB family protein [Gemmatimonadota bacterium]
MATVTIPRPVAADYPPYFAQYIEQVPDGDVIDLLKSQVEDTMKTLSAVKEAEAGFRYAPGKWSIREVVGHVVDTERIFVYRAVCFARGETNPLPGFDENVYAANSGADGKSLVAHLDEFRTQRAATVSFLSGLSAEALLRRGTANSREYVMRAIPFIIAGHERHHLGVIKERYLAKLTT